MSITFPEMTADDIIADDRSETHFPVSPEQKSQDFDELQGLTRPQWLEARFWLRSRNLFIFCAFLTIVAGASAVRSGTASQNAISIHTVARNDFSVPINTSGSVKPVRSDVVRSECHWNTHILRIVPEGTWVQEGDVVCELDSSEIEESLHQWEIPLISARASLEASVQEELIQKSGNDRLLSSARFKLQQAENELEQYEFGTWPQQSQQLESDIVVQEDQLRLAQEELQQTRHLWAQGLASDRVMEQAEYDRDLQAESLRRLQQKLRFRNTLQHDRDEVQLSFQKHNAEREVLRTEIASSLSLTAAQIKTMLSERRARIYERYREYARQSLAACQIRAPSSGQVIYANSWQQLSRGVSAIGEGQPVAWQQALFEIPDQSEFRVNVSIHESLIAQVKKGQGATVCLKGYEGVPISGWVSGIAEYSHQRNYFSPETRDYDVEITLIDPEKTLRDSVRKSETDAGQDQDSGNLVRLHMDAEVVLNVGERKNVVTIPRDAIEGTGRITYVLKYVGRNAFPVPVRAGEFNDETVCIESGLEEGDRIAVNLSQEQRMTLRECIESELQIAQR